VSSPARNTAAKVGSPVAAGPGPLAIGTGSGRNSYRQAFEVQQLQRALDLRQAFLPHVQVNWRSLTGSCDPATAEPP